MAARQHRVDIELPGDQKRSKSGHRRIQRVPAAPARCPPAEHRQPSRQPEQCQDDHHELGDPVYPLAMPQPVPDRDGDRDGRSRRTAQGNQPPPAPALGMTPQYRRDEHDHARGRDQHADGPACGDGQEKGAGRRYALNGEIRDEPSVTRHHHPRRHDALRFNLLARSPALTEAAIASSVPEARQLEGRAGAPQLAPHSGAPPSTGDENRTNTGVGSGQARQRLPGHLGDQLVNSCRSAEP